MICLLLNPASSKVVIAVARILWFVYLLLKPHFSESLGIRLAIVFFPIGALQNQTSGHGDGSALCHKAVQVGLSLLR